MNRKEQPLVAIVMGSKNDWRCMKLSAELLTELNIPYHAQVVSAHRTPDLLFDFAETAEANGFEIIIAGAGGSAHLPGMLAAKTTLPIIGVPIQSKSLNGLDSLLSIVQMPAGIPVATVAIGDAGAKNSALLATAFLANKYPTIKKALKEFRKKQTQLVINNLNLEEESQ